MLDLERRGNVAVITMSDGENRFNRHSIDTWHRLLDEVLAGEGPLALVTTGTGKFYSNGLDLAWMGDHPDDAMGLVADVHRLLGRMIGLEVITVAAVNGHAFAGGAMLATAHDFVVMRDDRGFWCLPEVDLGLPLTPAMHAVITAKLPRLTAHEAMMTGKRYTARQALASGIAHRAAPEDLVLDEAVVLAAEYVEKDRQVLAEHKRLSYERAIKLCGV
jgi:Delta3-Delta2-enoyl-CoA isomerase